MAAGRYPRGRAGPADVGSRCAQGSGRLRGPLRRRFRYRFHHRRQLGRRLRQHRLVPLAAALLKVHPSRPDTVYVGLADSGDRAFRSTDGGRIWEGFARRVARDGLLDLAFGGATWKDLGVSPSVAAVALDDFRTLYVADLQTGQLLRTGDGGASWQAVHRPPSDGSLYRALAVDATDPDTLYVGTYQQGVLRSRDDGVTLKPIGALFDPPRQPIEFLATFRGQPGILYAGASFGGLFAGRF